MKRNDIAPGIWLDEKGHPHFDIPELLALAGLEDTLENRQAATEIAVHLIRKHAPRATIVGTPK
jgi:hypothetical protein